MAELTFDLKDLREVDRICEEFDPETHELTAFHIRRVRDLADRLDLLTFMRRSIRGELMVGLAARAMGDALARVGMVDPRATRGWIDEDYEGRYGTNYDPEGTPVPDGRHARVPSLSLNLGRVGNEQTTAWTLMDRWWSNDPVVFAAFYALLDLAYERLFGNPDEELQRWMEQEGITE